MKRLLVLLIVPLLFFCGGGNEKILVKKHQLFQFDLLGMPLLNKTFIFDV